MTTLVVGATGATGHLLVRQLLDRDIKVKVIVRTPDKFSEEIRNHINLSIIQASVLDLGDDALAQHVKGCGAVASCLGHKDIYGHPRKLVTDATSRLCDAIASNNPDQPVKFVLMNTAGNINKDLSEQVSFAQMSIIRLLRLLLPPHVDNEMAAEYLRTKIGQNNQTVKWSVVRPDDLIDEDEVSEYMVHPSPIRSAIFDAGKTSRINVGHFMAELITNNDIWNKWQGQMPVIYNKSSN